MKRFVIPAATNRHLCSRPQLRKRLRRNQSVVCGVAVTLLAKGAPVRRKEVLG
jgi:hypothetical protein